MSAASVGRHDGAEFASASRDGAGGQPGSLVPGVRESSLRVRAGGHDWHVVRVATDQVADRGRAAATRPTCLCAHGTGASVHSMLPLARELAATHDVHAVDLPAHAGTRSPRGGDVSIEGCATAIEALVAELGIAPDLLVGHSAGAVVLARLALVRGRNAPPLVSIAGSLLPLGGPAGVLFPPLARVASGAPLVARLFARRAALEPGRVARLLATTGSRVPPESLARYRALLSDPEHVAGVLRMMAAWRLHAFARTLPSLASPVHLVAGSRDGTIPPRHQHRLHALLPAATLSLVEGAGHLVHEEAPARVAALILARLRGDAPA